MSEETQALTEEELTQLAARFGYQLPSRDQLKSSIEPGPLVAGQVPEAYQAERYRFAGDESSGQAGKRRATVGQDGRSRNLVFPPAPQALPVAVPDNHTHMDLLDGDVAVSVGDALDVGQAVGIDRVVQVGCDLPSSVFAVAAARADRRVLAAVALHPNEAPALAEAGQLEASLDVIGRLAADERVRAVGETGLDYFRTGPDGRVAQQHSFREHIRLAKRLGKALQIHDRQAHEDVLAILESEGAPEATVFHCFSGDEQLAQVCNERGWMMSFSGTVTFKNSAGLQRALRLADPSLLLVETDAPFLTPHPFRGRPNASYMDNYTVRFMADFLGRDLEGFCRQLAANSEAVYGPWF